MNVLLLTDFATGAEIYANPSQMMHWREGQQGTDITFSDGSVMKVSDKAEEISECLWEWTR